MINCNTSKNICTREYTMVSVWGIPRYSEDSALKTLQLILIMWDGVKHDMVNHYVPWVCLKRGAPKFVDSTLSYQHISKYPFAGIHPVSYPSSVGFQFQQTVRFPFQRSQQSLLTNAQRKRYVHLGLSETTPLGTSEVPVAIHFRMNQLGRYSSEISPEHSRSEPQQWHQTCPW